MPSFDLPNLSSISSNLPSFNLPTVYLPNLPALPFINWGPALPKMLPVPKAPLNFWGVFMVGTRNPVFDVDSCHSFDFEKETKVSNFPVENGAFATYNKVIEPITVKIRLAVSGLDRLQAFLTSLSAETNSTNLYNVRTPEVGYTNTFTISKFRYNRTKDKGAYVIFADLTLTEVRQVAPAYTTVKQPAAKSKSPKSASAEPKGKVSPLFDALMNKFSVAKKLGALVAGGN